MKTKFITILALLSFFGIAQTNKVIFNYDNAGNQIKRTLVITAFTSKSSNETIENDQKIVQENLLKFSNEDVISYYPNPVKEELYLQWELINENNVSKIEVYSFDGKLLRFHNNLQSENNKTISFQEMTTGNYLVILFYTNGEQKTIKIIKK